MSDLLKRLKNQANGKIEIDSLAKFYRVVLHNKSGRKAIAFISKGGNVYEAIGWNARGNLIGHISGDIPVARLLGSEPPIGGEREEA